MSKQIQYPSDTVDASGNVFPTVGEMIRNGEKNYTKLLTTLTGKKISTLEHTLSISPNTAITSDNDLIKCQLNYWSVDGKTILFAIPVDINVEGSTSNIGGKAIMNSETVLYARNAQSDTITGSVKYLVFYY